MSQFSDIYPSSLYEGDILDQSSYLASEDLHLFTPELPESQRMVTSTTEPPPLPPPPPVPPVPLTLQRVGLDRQKTYVLFMAETKKDFMDWWFQTQIGATEPVQKKIHWDGSRHHSEIWSHFEQVAHYITGEPKVMCKRCRKLLDHPNHTSNGTNSIRRHWSRNTCQKTAQASKQPSIQRLMQHAVCTIEERMKTKDRIETR
jgi:hypothetical protein